MSLVVAVTTERLTYKTTQRLVSDEPLLLLIRGDDINEECDHILRRLNYPKEDWLLFRKCFDNGIHAMTSFLTLSNCLVVFGDLILSAKADAVSIRRSTKERSHG